MASNSVPPPVDLQNLANEVSQGLDKAKARTELANDQHWVSQEWNDSSISRSAKYCLERADRCVMGASSLAELLHRFSMAAVDIKNTGPEDEVQVIYPQISSNEMDRLWLALNELLSSAELGIQHARNLREVRRD